MILFNNKTKIISDWDNFVNKKMNKKLKIK